MSGQPLGPYRRRWLRISVRSLIILVLLVGGWLGWIVNSVRVQREAVSAIRKSGGFVQYDWEWKNGDLIQGQQRPAAPRWLVDRIGVDYFGEVTRVYLAGSGADAVLVDVARLSHLENLNLSHSAVTDAGIAHLKGLSNLQYLDLTDTRVSDESLVHLARLPMLKVLHLSGTSISDSGLANLGRMTRLKELDLDRTRAGRLHHKS